LHDRHSARLALMKTEQRTWTQGSGWMPGSSGSLAQSAQLVVVFGATSVLQDPSLVNPIREYYPSKSARIGSSKLRIGAIESDWSRAVTTGTATDQTR
jgi:hypothetical protein